MRSVAFLFVLCVAAFLGGCAEEPAEPDPTPVIMGTVADAADSSPVAGANVMLYDANTNEPVDRATTNADGGYGFTVDVGTYYLWTEAQGFLPSPPVGGTPLPFHTALSDTSWQHVYLGRDPAAASLGGFAGHVRTAGDEPVCGVLVTAVSSQGAYSSTSGSDGYYVFFNIPPGTYDVEVHAAGYVQDSATVAAVVTAGAVATGVTATMTAGAEGVVTGHVAFVATSPPSVDIDVTLIHPDVREAVPGLATVIDPSGGDYSITSVPLGKQYIVWASYRNDGYVMDPDAIQKFGHPLMALTEGNPDTSIDFKVTGAIILDSPTNEPDSIYPVAVTTTTPTLTWTKTSAYASAKEFIVEVFNSRGETIWGGYDGSGVIRHQSIPASGTPSVEYNFDGSATDSLRVGGVYRWKVYADDSDNPNVQTLLSASEDLMGLFKVVAP